MQTAIKGRHRHEPTPNPISQYTAAPSRHSCARSPRYLPRERGSDFEIERGERFRSARSGFSTFHRMKRIPVLRDRFDCRPRASKARWRTLPAQSARFLEKKHFRINDAVSGGTVGIHGKALFDRGIRRHGARSPRPGASVSFAQSSSTITQGKEPDLDTARGKLGRPRCRRYPRLSRRQRLGDARILWSGDSRSRSPTLRWH